MRGPFGGIHRFQLRLEIAKQGLDTRVICRESHVVGRLLGFHPRAEVGHELQSQRHRAS